MIIITQQQYKRLRRLLRRCNGEQYELKLTLVRATTLMPGYMSITACTAALYNRVVKLLKMVVPEVQLKYETGFGWHTGDRTEYHFGSFDFMVK